MHKTFFERWLPKRKKTDAPPTPESTLADLHAALANIEGERQKANAVLDQHAAERRHMLLSDAPDADIAAHDLAGDRARIQHEKLDHAEREINAQISDIQAEVEDREFSAFLDQWHLAAYEFSNAARAAREAQGKFIAVNASAPPAYHGRLQMHEPIRVIAPTMAFDQHVNFTLERERGRLAANEQARAAKRAAENEGQ